MDTQFGVLMFLTLGLAISGSALKNGVLTWASVVMWIILGIFITMNYTWLGNAQWIFILLGFGLAIGMAFETTTYRTKVEDEDTGDEISPEDKILIERQERFQKMMGRINKIMPRKHKDLSFLDRDDDE